MGNGDEIPYLKSIANDNIEFLGRVVDNIKNKYLSTCRALIFPGVEDFGIIPVEAMACGRPVIAYNKGGATETVKNNISGLLFEEQTVKSLNLEISRYESLDDHFNPTIIRELALQFDKQIFQNKFKEYIDYCLEDFHKTGVSKKR